MILLKEIPKEKRYDLAEKTYQQDRVEVLADEVLKEDPILEREEIKTDALETKITPDTIDRIKS